VVAQPILIRVWELQTQGKIGMWFDYGNTYAKQASVDPAAPTTAFTTLMAPPPVGNTGLVSADITVVGYHISATASDASACMKFINFLSRQIVRELVRKYPSAQITE